MVWLSSKGSMHMGMHVCMLSSLFRVHVHIIDAHFSQRYYSSSIFSNGKLFLSVFCLVAYQKYASIFSVICLHTRISRHYQHHHRYHHPNTLIQWFESNWFDLIGCCCQYLIMLVTSCVMRQLFLFFVVRLRLFQCCVCAIWFILQASLIIFFYFVCSHSSSFSSLPAID